MVQRHLFVYGTLMSVATGRMGSGQRARLSREATLLGAAITQGRLYDLGEYPGLVPTTDTAELVHGEVYELHDAELSFAWLDAYEGIMPGATAAEYTRVARPVVLDVAHDVGAARARREIVAFLYVWQSIETADGSAGQRLMDGRWVSRRCVSQ